MAKEAVFFCNCEFETDEHVFLACPFTKSVTFSSQLEVRLDNLQMPRVEEVLRRCLDSIYQERK